MPRPSGWTADHERKRDRCVRELMADGVPAPKTATQRGLSDESRAYAICTAAVEHSRAGANPTDPMEFARDVVKALKSLFSV